MSSSARAYWDNYYDTHYGNATQITTYGSYSSTNRFNCHGYAWYMEESGSGLNDPRWIGYYYTTAEDVYMTDGSYVQVASEMYPGKVSWGSGDHSALTTSQSGVYKSKWNKYPLFVHNWDDTPYGTNNLKYYVSTNIIGSSGELCNNSTRYFSTRNISGATYDWEVGSGLALNSDGDYSTSVTAYSSFYGSTWIEVTITSPLEGSNNDVKTSKRKIFWVGTPYVNPATIQFSCIEGPGYFCTNAFGNEFSFTYDHQYNYFDIKLTNLGETQTLTQFRIYSTWGTMDYSPPDGTYLFHVRGNNDCGTATNWSKKGVEYEDCGMGGLFSLDIYPNPASEQATITIISTEDKDAITKKVDEEWQLEVYSQGQLLKHSVPAIIDNRYVLNTSGWKPGMYFIRAYYKDEVVFGTLVVNK